MNDNAASQDVVDASGNGHTATSYRNTDGISVAGKINTALSFDGTDDYVSVPSLGYGNTSKFSISFWAKPTATETQGLFTSRSDGSYTDNAIWAHLTSENKIRFGLVGVWTVDQIDLTANNALPSGTWTHVIISYNGNGLASGVEIYINGDKASKIVDTDNLSGSINSGTSWMWGKNWVSGFRGSMDDVRFFNRELVASEIAFIYNSGSGIESCAVEPEPTPSQVKRDGLMNITGLGGLGL